MTQVPIGNFSLPFSQQPGPLVSFGQDVVDQGILQLFLFGDAFLSKNGHLVDLSPGLLYGITDKLSVFLNVPFSPGNKDQDAHSSGLEDVFIQLEYAYYFKDTLYTMDVATVVFTSFFPTGSSIIFPPTGYGSSSFLLGLTYSHTEVCWFFFTSPGVILTTSKHENKFGDQLLYQFGLGRNIATPPGWIFACMAEFTGFYSWKNQFDGVTDPDSGGNVIYITPSLWLSSRRLIAQGGVGFPVVQTLFGDQSNQSIALFFNFGVTF